MAYKICPKTTQKNKDCQLKEEDDIAKLFNKTEVESFDIKPEWLDDMSAQLDAHNSTMRRKKYWWFVLLALPAVLIPLFMFIYSGTDSAKKTAETNIVTTNKSIENQTSPQKNQTELMSGDSEQSSESTEDITTATKKSSTVATTEVKEEKSATRDDLKQSPTVKAKNNNSFTKKASSKANPNTRDLKQNNLATVSTNGNTLPTSEKNNRNTGQNKSSNSALPLNSQSRKPIEASAKKTNTDFKDKINVATSADKTIEIADSMGTKADAEHTASGQINTENTADSITQDKTPVTHIVNADTLMTANNLSRGSIKPDSSVAEQTEASDNSLADEGIDKETNTKIEKDKKNSEKLWSIGFTLGPDFLAKSFTASTDFLNFEQKKEEEVFDNTWGYDFEINRYLTPWLMVGSGIGFKKYQEVNNYSATSTISFDTIFTFQDNSFMTFTDSIDSIFVDANGGVDTFWVYTDSILVIDTMTVMDVNSQTQTDSSKKVANGTVTSSYIQIPINAQFVFVNTKKLTAYANLGLTIGLLTKNTGKVVDFNTNEIVNFTTRKMIYTSNIGLGFNYNLFGPLDYKLYGAYQFNLTNLSVTPNVDKRYNGLTFRTGLVFHF